MFGTYAPVVVEVITQQADALSAGGRLQIAVNTTMQTAEIIETKEIGSTTLSGQEI